MPLSTMSKYDNSPISKPIEKQEVEVKTKKNKIGTSSVIN